MTYNGIDNEYFNWLLDIVCYEKHHDISYSKLLRYLHSITFRYSIPNDENRAKDGENLRYKFLRQSDYTSTPDYLFKPCSVLEMMVALAYRCEDTIMDNTQLGNRTGQWFWNMITNLGLSNMLDKHFDINIVDDIVNRFLDREYEPDGSGGLFRIKYCNWDLRKMSIWSQMCWYLDSFI